MSMQSENTMRMERTARFGEWICIIGILLVGGYSAYLVFNPAEAIAVLQRGIPGQIYLPSDNMLLLAGMIAMLPMLLFLVAMLQARKMFLLIGSGFFLTKICQKLLMQLGRIAMASAILSVIVHTLVVLLLTSANPPGQKLVLIEIGSGEISAVIFSILFFTFALLVKESAAIAEENKSFI